MRRFYSILLFSSLFAGAAFAEKFSGALLDASCYDQQNQVLKDMSKAAAACGATGQSTAFAIHQGDKVLRLDASGNTKAKSALSSRADRNAPGAALSKINADVDGTESGGTIRVTSIDLQ